MNNILLTEEEFNQIRAFSPFDKDRSSQFKKGMYAGYLETHDWFMNNIELLQECKLQLEYLNQKFPSTGTTNSLLAKIEAALQNKVKRK